MKHATLALGLALALVLGGCCCGEPETGRRTASASTPEAAQTGRRFIVVRATRMGLSEDGRRQLLIESSVVAVRRAGPIDAIDRAERLAVGEAPVWLAGTQVPDATFGAHSEVVQRPSVVTQEDDEATIQVAETSGDGADRNMSEIHAVPSYDASGGMTLTFRYDHYDHGRHAFTVPPVALTGPAGRVFIIEALPLR